MIKEKWKPPEVGWVKVNVDGATKKGGEGGGTGVIFRNHEGAYMSAGCHFIPRCNNPERMELLACRDAAAMAEELDIPYLHIETDCREIVGKLQSSKRDLSALGPTVEEVKLLLASRESWKVSWVRREANKAAHLVAREAVANQLDFVWRLTPPDFILHVVSDEIPTWDD